MSKDTRPTTKKRIGVFVCHCGRNIAETVDVEKVAKIAKDKHGVVFSAESHYLCSEPGQKEIQDAIRLNNLDSLICACCSPSMHEETFRGVAEKSGMNRYQVEIANIREKCSWVHSDRTEATAKAIKIVETKIEKAFLNESLTPISVEVNKNCLVVGAGVTGIPFTDPLCLEQNCGIQNPFDKRPELSSDFIYRFISAYGSAESFYSKFLISSLCPLGFVRNGKNLN